MKTRAASSLLRARKNSQFRQQKLALQASRRAEQSYLRGLSAVFRGVHSEYVDYLLRVAGRQDSKHDGILTALELTLRFQVQRKVGAAFQRMAGEVLQKANSAAHVIGITPTDVSVTIDKFRDQNIRLVEDALREYSQDVREVFSNAENFGVSVDELQKQLLERGNVSEARARLIARDQTLKLNGQINAERQKAAGVEKYVWSTSHDERVRESHAELDGKTFGWGEETPIGYAPGQDYQCRCIALAVLDEFAGI